VLIAHPGGPFWAKKHEGAWSIPKGEFDPATEPAMAAAAREFAEEIGSPAPPTTTWTEIGETTLKSGKRIIAWAAAVTADIDVASLQSNTFEIEWPPRSGRRIAVPEVDEIRWCQPAEAIRLLNPAQRAFVQRLMARLAEND